MIHVLLTRRHAYTLSEHLETWGRDVRGKVVPLHYEDLALAPRLSPGTYVFADLERVTEPQMELARETHRQLSARLDSFRLLNNPARVLCRFELLRALHAAGINRFTAHRVADADKVRFPAFVRRASEHDGALSPIVSSRQELDVAVAEALSRGVPREDLIIVEYCDTSDAAGVYRKYSAFCVGDRILPRHIFHSRKWMLKKADLVEPGQVEEELAYLRSNPHEKQLRRVFELAHVDYGRVDYALLDGPTGPQVQVWEINTNPTITVPPSRTDPTRLLGQGLFTQQFHEAMAGIALDPPTTTTPHYLNIPSSLSRRLGSGAGDRAARFVARAFRFVAKQLDPPIE